MAESVCKLLEERGHEVIRLREKLATDSPDPLVAKYAQDIEAILISHDSDFSNIASPKKKGRRFRRLSRVNLKCPNAVAGKRLAAALSLIEFEYVVAQTRPEKRIIIDVQPTLIRTLR